MNTPIEVWKCCECGEVHEDEYDAQDCCRPEIEEGYRCPVCRNYHAEEDDAAYCCPAADSDDIPLLERPATAQERAATGLLF